MSNKKYDSVTGEEAAKIHGTKPNLSLVLKKIVAGDAKTSPAKLLQDPEEWANISLILLTEPEQGSEFSWEGAAEEFNLRVQTNSGPGKALKKLSRGEYSKGCLRHCRTRLAEANEALGRDPVDGIAQAKKDEIHQILVKFGWPEFKPEKAKKKPKKGGKDKGQEPGVTKVGLIPEEKGKVEPTALVQSTPGNTVPKSAGETGELPSGLFDPAPEGLPYVLGKHPGEPSTGDKAEPLGVGAPLDRPIEGQVKSQLKQSDEQPKTGTSEQTNLAHNRGPSSEEYLVPLERNHFVTFQNTHAKPDGMVFVTGYAKPFANFINENGGGFRGQAWIKPDLKDILERSIRKFELEHPKVKP